jgi:AcrR family transcriptional regulator
MARTPDLERRQELLDRIVVYLADHGLAQVTLRPMAAELGVSINRLVHHFGSKDELIATALARSIEQQIEVADGWSRRHPDAGIVEHYRRWWRWINASPANLALVRLNYEAAALSHEVTGLAGDVRADQIGVWRHDIEHRLLREGVPPARVEVEASLVKAMFSGLVMDLLATGDRARVTAACHQWLERLPAVLNGDDAVPGELSAAPSPPRTRRSPSTVP